MVQKACGEKADEDPDFAYELDTFKFRVPTVRFSYEYAACFLRHSP